MKILFFTQSGPRGASSRYRVYQFLPFLREHGWSCRVAPAVPPVLHETYFFSKNIGWKAMLSVFIAIRRVLQLFLIPFADIVFVQKPLLPLGWQSLEPLAAKLARKLVFDFDDAIFLPSPIRGQVLSPQRLRDRFQKIIRSADLALAGNAFLAEEAEVHARRVEIFPTAVDTRRFACKTERTHDSCVIGWMGSPSTAVYLKEFVPVVTEISRRFSVRWVFVGGKMPGALPEGLPIVFENWAYETEVAKMQSFDIFVSPLEDTPWEKGKCGLKTLTAMSAGLSVIASAVGVHKEIIQDGGNGFLAATPQEWKEKLSLLLSDAALRKRLGEKARQTVEQHFDLAKAVPRLMALLQGL